MAKLTAAETPGRRLRRRRDLVEPLESRLLLSADLTGVALGAALVAPFDPSTAEIAELPSAQPLATFEHRVATGELVFVDRGIEDYEELVRDLRESADGDRAFEIVILDAERDGIAQISEALAERDGVAAVHFFSHGADGTLALGSTRLSSANLADHAESLRGWSGALATQADLLFYGCDLAASAEGRSFVESVAALTGADVAASSDPTGASILGGDWHLEHATGFIETEVAVSPRLQEEFASVLAVGVDASSSGLTTDQSSVTVSHTTSGTNRLMLVGVAMDPHGDSVSSITYNGVNLTFVGAEEASGTHSRVEIWALVAPDTGTHDVVVNLTGTSHNGVTVGVTTFTGVNQTAPLLHFSSASGSSTTASATVVSATDDLVFGAVHSHNGADVVPDASQTELWDVVSDQSNGGGSVAAGAASVVTSWTVADSEWSVAAVSVQADTNASELTSLSPVQDAYIQLKNPTTNTGTDGTIVVDREDGDLQRALLQFDLSSIPAGSTIHSASLKLEATSVDGLLNIDVHQILEPWAEGSTTWNERSSGTSWSTAGGSFDPTALDSLAITAKGQHAFDITNLAQDWLDGAQQNDGVLLASFDGGGNRTVIYDSREGTVAPALEIIYTPPATNQPPTLSLTPVVTTLAEDADTSGAIVVATIALSDDALGTNSLALTGADAGLFEIVGSDLRLRAGAALDYETNPSLDVTVTVDDPSLTPDPDDSASYTVKVTDARLGNASQLIEIIRSDTTPPDDVGDLIERADDTDSESGEEPSPEPEQTSTLTSTTSHDSPTGDTGGPTPTLPPTLTTSDVPIDLEPEESSAESERIREAANDASTSPRSAKAILERLLAGISPGTSLSDLIFVGNELDFIDALDRMGDEVDAVTYLEEKLAGSTLAVTTGLSVGYLFWLTRGGLLLASLLSTMPAWRLIDPIPILARLRDDEGENPEDSESLSTLVSRSDPPQTDRSDRARSSSAPVAKR